MEITGWTIYWITRLDALGDFLQTMAIVSLLASVACGVVGGIMCGEVGPESGKKVLRWMRLTVPTSVGFFMLWAFTPSVRDAAAIIVLPALANNEDVQGLGEDFVNLAREWMQELRPKEEK